jgi:hypothetical protein
MLCRGMSLDKAFCISLSRISTVMVLVLATLHNSDSRMKLTLTMKLETTHKKTTTRSKKSPSLHFRRFCAIFLPFSVSRPFPSAAAAATFAITSDALLSLLLVIANKILLRRFETGVLGGGVLS